MDINKNYLEYLLNNICSFILNSAIEPFFIFNFNCKNNLQIVRIELSFNISCKDPIFFKSNDDLFL